MPHALTMPVIAGLSIIASAAGVQLGRSAIEEINPKHFAEAPSHFYSELAPNPRPDWAQVQASEYQQGATAPAPAAAQGGCVGCQTWPVDVRPARDPGVERALAEASRQMRIPGRAPAVRYADVVVYEAPREDPARDHIRRYARYPVTRDEVLPPEPDEEDAPDAGDAATQ